MPKGQDRYANRSRKRTPRSGQTIRIGNTVGVAPLVGEYDDVRRWLKDLIADGLSAQTLERLGRWCVQMAEAEGFTPATDVHPTIQRAIDQSLHNRGILHAEGESDFKPADCIRLEPESKLQRWQREDSEHERKCLYVEEVEAALNLAKKYGEQDLVAVLEQQYDAEQFERIKRERYQFQLKYLDVLNANGSQSFLFSEQAERERRVRFYGPQTADFYKRRAEVEREFANRPKRTKTQDRKEGRLVGTAMEMHGWEEHGVYSAFRKVIQKRGHQLAKDE